MTGRADPPPPSPAELGALWARLAVTPITELHGGFQSTVWLVGDDGSGGRADRLVVKVVPTGGPGDDVRRRRVDVAHRLAAADPAVVGPLDRGPGLVVDVGRWSSTCHRFVDGRRPRPDSAADVEAMGRTLADLHRAMAVIGPVDLPPVAALATAGAGPVDGPGRPRLQLLHGDYGGANLLVTDGGLRVIDLDDCGLGPVEFELGNSLYLELFDAWHADDLDRFGPFRDHFLTAYRSAAAEPIDEAEIERSIQRRLGALVRWLDEPATAPVGIRSSSSEWRDHLRTFVDRFIDDRSGGGG